MYTGNFFINHLSRSQWKLLATFHKTSSSFFCNLCIFSSEQKIRLGLHANRSYMALPREQTLTVPRNAGSKAMH